MEAQDLMPHEFIAVPQAPFIDHAIRVNHHGIVDSQTRKRRHEVLHGGDPDSLPAEGGGQSGFHNIIDKRPDPYFLWQILAHKYNAVVAGGRSDR